MRNLGRFFGHIVAGAKTDTDTDRREVSRKVVEEHLDTPDGNVTLRRTVIEEIEFDRNPGPGHSGTGETQ